MRREVAILHRHNTNQSRDWHKRVTFDPEGKKITFEQETWKKLESTGVRSTENK
jgi:hypothetical protein